MCNVSFLLYYTLSASLGDYARFVLYRCLRRILFRALSVKLSSPPPPRYQLQRFLCSLQTVAIFRCEQRPPPQLSDAPVAANRLWYQGGSSAPNSRPGQHAVCDRGMEAFFSHSIINYFFFLIKS